MDKRKRLFPRLFFIPLISPELPSRDTFAVLCSGCSAYPPNNSVNALKEYDSQEKWNINKYIKLSQAVGQHTPFFHMFYNIQMQLTLHLQITYH